MGAFYARIIGKNIPKIYTAHNVFHDKRFLTKFSLKDTKCIACGNTVKLNLKDFFNINNVSVIKNSVKVPTKISAPKDKILSDNSKILVGFIGRLTEQKGADIFIEALANAIKNSPNIHGIIVGDGELKEQLQLLSKQFRVDDRITFLGMRKDVYPIIKMLDFVVLPSRYEGFPLLPIETFAMEKTIIASDIDNNKELIKNNYNGLLFESQNAKDLSENIRELSTNKSLLRKLSKNAKKYYDKNLNYEDFISKYSRAYQEMGGYNE